MQPLEGMESLMRWIVGPVYIGLAFAAIIVFGAVLPPLLAGPLVFVLFLARAVFLMIRDLREKLAQEAAREAELNEWASA